MGFARAKYRVGALGVLALSACAATDVPSGLASPLVGLDLARITAANYELTPQNSEVGFRVKPLGLSAVEGAFGQFEGSLTLRDAVAGEGRVEAVVQTATAATDDGRYEDMMKGEGWFDTAQFETAMFRGDLTGWRPDGTSVVQGEMTIRDVTRDEEFMMRLTCEGLAACPSERVGFEGQLRLSRAAYGMTRLKGVVGDTVTLSVTGQLRLVQEGDTKTE